MVMNERVVVVIGGGAAGLMAAGRAGQAGARVILLEKNRTIGRKIGITGKGRCNVTNAGDIPAFIANYHSNGQFLYSAFSRFANEDLVRFFETKGVPLKRERGGRIFPVSDKAADIVAALGKFVAESGVAVRLNEEAVEIIQAKGAVSGVKTAGGYLRASRVVIATGGKSYPATGSTGDGYRWAEQLGHTVIPPRPALVPLNTREEWSKELQGLSLKNIEAVLKRGDKVLAREFGEMLFTHFGVSGPVILTLSRYAVEVNAAPGQLRLELNLKPALDGEKLDRRLQRDFAKFQRKQLKNALDELLPKSLVLPVLRAGGIDPEKYVHQVTKKERQELLRAMTALTLTIEGPRSLAEAIVTAGGVSLKEVNPRSMESRLVQGLYFAGEVLDIDGYTGGYNLQAAFSTGYMAGEHAALDK